MNSPTPLSVRTDLVQIEVPFEGDALRDRKGLADRLTKYVDRLQAGAVIGISAPWGEGKTWFGKNWAKALSADHKVAFIDAFENDYIDDPFLLIASELSSLIDSGAAGTLKKSAVGVMKAMVPLGTKAMINLAGRFLVGSADISEEFDDAVKAATDGAADKGEAWLEKRFESLASERASLKGFKVALTKAVAGCDKPVVIFIDELDRCKPSFAVTLIERLKHLFDVQNLVFILLLNREQLERTIEGHYGAGTDGRAYLGKFINLSFELPRASLSPNEPDRRYEDFAAKTLEQYKFPKDKTAAVEEFKGAVGLWAMTWRLSLRDVERMCTLFVLADAASSPMLGYMIARKVHDPQLFARFRTLDPEAHIQCATELQAMCTTGQGDSGHHWPDTFFRCIAESHLVIAGKLEIGNAATLNEHGRSLLGSFRNPERAFQVVAGKIDLPVDLN